MRTVFAHKQDVFGFECAKSSEVDQAGWAKLLNRLGLHGESGTQPDTSMLIEP